MNLKWSSIGCFLFILPFISSIDVNSCGKTKDCIFSPPGCKLFECAYFLSLSSEEDWTVFELATSNITHRTNYIAIGMSEDDLMGEEAISFCYFPPEGPPTVSVGFNHGKSNVVADETLKSIIEENIQMIHAEKKDSTLFCSFRQKIHVAPIHEMFPNLSTLYTLFIARGNARNPTHLGIHGLSPSSPEFPFISPSSINLTHFYPQGNSVAETTNVAADQNETTTTTAAPSTALYNLSMESRFWMMKFHGILMIIPWLCLIPSAILSSRYLRQEWAATTPGGLKIWFHIHRTLNWFSFILLIISTLLILIAKDFVWKGPWWNKLPGKSTSPGAIHSLIGAISLGGTLFQVLLALIRPAPDSRFRKYFNGIHRVVGFLSLIAAMIATIIAANFFLKLWSIPTRPLLLSILSVAIIIFTIILFEVESRFRRKKVKDEIEMTGGPSSPQIQTPRESLARKIIFFLFILVSLPISVYLSYHLIS